MCLVPQREERKAVRFAVVSTELVDNGSERERSAQTQKQREEKKERKKERRINGGMLKARCRRELSVLKFELLILLNS